MFVTLPIVFEATILSMVPKSGRALNYQCLMRIKRYPVKVI
ncbi:hypothetical protein CLERM_615 [Coxiella-like endosymbiont]|nr:hypothetical protein CLERM_615 [Coxiella-like endosymbiont]